MEVKLADGNAPEWDEFVARNSNGSFYHLHSWRELMEQHFGHEAFYLMARDDGRVRGVLPLIRLRSRLFGDSLVSLPYFMSGGVVAEDEAATNALINRARELVDSTDSRRLIIRQNAESFPGMVRDDSKSTFEVGLDPNPDKVFETFERQVRRQIRKARRTGLEAEWGDGCLPDFYGVYATNMRDIGVPIHGYGFYETMLRRFPDIARVFVVRHEGKAIAGQFLFTFRDRIMLVNAGSLREYLSLCPNHLLYWESVRFGCENGYRVCDFGRSPKGSGPHTFKAQWSGKERDFYTHYLDASGEAMNKVSAENSRYKLVRRVWQSMPVGLTKIVGPRLVKSLP